MRTKEKALINAVIIQYSTEDSTAPLLAPPNTNQDITSNYYYVYT